MNDKSGNTTARSGGSAITGLVIIAAILCSCASTAPYPENSVWAHNGITSLEKIEINGLKHSVLVRGTDLANPILLHIHGAGIPTMCFAHLEYPGNEGSMKELKFIAVHYDQRGYGKTYIHGKHSTKYCTMEQYVSDAEEMVRHLMKRFHKEKIFLLGESWGSAVAMHIVKNHPDWFYAYIGASQVANIIDYMDDVYDYVEIHARRDNNQEALKALASPGRTRLDMTSREVYKSVFNAGDWMDHYQALEYDYENSASFFFSSLRNAPEYSGLDFMHTLSGYISTQKKLGSVYAHIDLMSQVPEVEIPVYFIMGERDLYMSSTKEYFDMLKAPLKEFVVIEDTGHYVRGDKYEEFDRIVYETILPRHYPTCANTAERAE